MSDQDAGALTSLPVAWRPDAECVERSRLRRFMRACGFADYDAFLAWSVAEPAAFWEAVVTRDLDLRFQQPYSAVLDDSGGPEWTTWFPGSRYNYVVNALDRWAEGPEAGRVCLVWEGDDGAMRAWTCAELAAETARVAAGLASLGFERGDRVGIFMPMTPETVAATLAVGKLGGAYVPIFSGYGPEAVAQRLRDCGARLLFTADGFLRRGQVVPMKETADAAFRLAPDVERVITFRRLGCDIPWDPTRDLAWEELTAGQPEAFPTAVTDPEEPCLLIYTSGTTGRPKGAVHPHCGFPLKAAQDMAHLFDVQPGDRLFWFTDLGWMMGPWAIIGALTLGAACVLYEGAPDHPHPGRVWEIVERHRVTHLGISPTAIRALMASGDEWPARHDLTSLRVLGSTGEPWNPASWEWYFRHVGGGRLPVINYSGGTEVSGGILGCVTLRPIRPCSFNTAVPGMAADVLDERGRPVRNAVGELVLRNVGPGTTRGFWNDRERYLETYWSRWPGTWVHGDWALRDDEDYWYILGRSDDTIKIAGKRVGPAEVESAVCAVPGVREAAAIGAPHPVKGEGLVVFVVPAQPGAAAEALAPAVTAAVVAALGKTLRPERVLLVPDLPKTRNGKVLRRLIRAAYLGRDPGDTSSLENPAALGAVASLGPAA
jgi:acetyl-CoA synthetase